ncbi:MAG: response regulator transcription factor [Ardenticatenaceae bacterium]|nr:response regulator transcription factor [Ardenticatenaceae bacterium]HBY94083.1 DNA-binding response regulator [Chloroflexota bacterium]
MRIVIIEDDRDAAEAISISLMLGLPNNEIVTYTEGEAALADMPQHPPDLVLLDVNLPGADGFEVCRRMRAQSSVPIIMLTAKDDELDIVKGLELGADDYVTKPFGHLQLLARIKAVLRRTQAPSPAMAAPTSGRVSFGEIEIDFERRQVLRDGHLVELTPTEYNLLYHLVRNAGRTMPHQMLLAKVWGPEYEDEIEYVKVYIRRLRDKLEPDRKNPRYIITDWGVGYRFEREC